MSTRATIRVAVAALVVATAASAHALPTYTANAFSIPTPPLGIPLSAAVATNGSLVVGRLDTAAGTTRLVTWDASTKAFVQDVGPDGLETGLGGVMPITPGHLTPGNDFYSQHPAASNGGALAPFRQNVNAPGLPTEFQTASPPFLALWRGAAGGLVLGADTGMTGGFGGERPVYWDASNPSAPPTFLASLTGVGQFGQAFDLTPSGGSILGNLGPVSTGPIYHAVSWETTGIVPFGTVVDHGTFGNAQAGFAYALSEDLWLGTTGDWSLGVNKPFLYQPSTGASALSLPDLGGGISFLLGFNRNGTFVGTAQDSSGAFMGALWQVSDPTSLSSLVEVALLPPLAGDVSAQALGVNDAGLVVGVSTNASGQSSAVWWGAVPEPGTALLVAVGLLGTALGRRRSPATAI